MTVRSPSETFRDLLTVARELLAGVGDYDALGALAAATVGADPALTLEAGEALHLEAVELGAAGVASYERTPYAFAPRASRHITARQRVVDLFDRALERTFVP